MRCGEDSLFVHLHHLLASSQSQQSTMREGEEINKNYMIIYVLLITKLTRGGKSTDILYLSRSTITCIIKVEILFLLYFKVKKRK